MCLLIARKRFRFGSVRVLAVRSHVSSSVSTVLFRILFRVSSSLSSSYFLSVFVSMEPRLEALPQLKVLNVEFNALSRLEGAYAHELKGGWANRLIVVGISSSMCSCASFGSQLI